MHGHGKIRPIKHSLTKLFFEYFDSPTLQKFLSCYNKESIQNNVDFMPKLSETLCYGIFYYFISHFITSMRMNFSRIVIDKQPK